MTKTVDSWDEKDMYGLQLGLQTSYWATAGKDVMLGLQDVDSLAMRRLKRHASHGAMEERFDEQPCQSCGRTWLWNRDIYPADEPHRCAQCAPDEHWETGIDPVVAEAIFRNAEVVQ